METEHAEKQWGDWVAPEPRQDGGEQRKEDEPKESRAQGTELLLQSRANQKVTRSRRAAKWVWTPQADVQCPKHYRDFSWEIKGVMETEILVLSEVIKTTFFISTSLEWQCNSWRFFFSSVLQMGDQSKNNYKKIVFFSFGFVYWNLPLQYSRLTSAELQVGLLLFLLPHWVAQDRVGTSQN